MLSQPLYFDYQSSTPADKEVIDYMNEYWSYSHGNPHSNEHFVGWSANKVIEDSRKVLSKLLGTDSDEIFFTSGATESNNLAIQGFVNKNIKKTKRNRILLTTIDHKCVIEAVKAVCLKNDLEFEFISVDKHGFIDLEDLEKKASENILIFTYILVNNEIGTIQNFNKIYDICSKFDIKIHTDAAQAPTTLELSDVSSKVNMLSLSGHKMYGPMGIGALYIERDLQNNISPIIYGGGQQNNIRSGTLPLALCAGIAKAAEICMREEKLLEKNRIKKLKNSFANEILDLNSNFSLNGPDLESRHIANANICFKNFIAEDLIGFMQPNLATSTGSACSSGITEPSHVLRAIGLNKEDSRASIRFSIGRKTDQKEINDALDLIKEAVSNFS